jgi:hypothetical protein
MSATPASARWMYTHAFAAHLLNIVEVQQQRGVPLEAIRCGQQRREGILMRQEVLPWQVAAAAAAEATAEPSNITKNMLVADTGSPASCCLGVKSASAIQAAASRIQYHLHCCCCCAHHPTWGFIEHYCPPCRQLPCFNLATASAVQAAVFAYRYTWEAAVVLTVPLGGSRSSTAPLQAACLVAPSCGHCPGAPAASAPLPASTP